ncbi:DUF4136 domain-containing protein [Paraflavitalea pollutisoli]|uniref:DUF4136 domain-containing protein n=1 Tax=Paraflavitalea pollutisoli TaxID=3034143 RepID=UPI0023EDB987|nr:DUF4136 domain-containing protein [Paraflavitalea sp. H1-2-19X]
MKKNMLPAICLATLLFNAACGPTLKVNTDYDKSTDFNKYKTFSLYMSDSTSSAISPLNQQRITSAVTQAMQSKGYQLVGSNPDLLVNTVTVIKNKVALSSNTDYYGYGGVYRPYYWGTGMGVSSTTNYNVQNYKDGSLIIDIVDASTKKLLWQGTGNSEIDKPLKDPDTQVPQAVNKILAGFPPGAAK